MIQYPRYRQHRFSSFQVIIAGFAAVDLVGALLLMLPIAAQQRCVTPFHEALYLHLCPLCDRTCSTGYRQLLVGIRAERNSSSDPDRRIGRHYSGRCLCAAFRAKDLPQAAQHDAGSYGCPTDGRHRAADRLYSADHRPV